MLFAKTVEPVYEIGLSHSLYLQLEEVQMKQAPLKKKKGEFAHSPTGGNGSCAWLPAGGLDEQSIFLNAASLCDGEFLCAFFRVTLTMQS